MLYGMDDDDWLYVALVCAYVIAAIAMVVDALWLLVLALSVFPIVLFWRCGDGREKKKPT